MKKILSASPCSGLTVKPDLIELSRVSKIIKDKKKFDYIDLNTILGMYEGHTIFSIFHDNEKFHEQVLR